MAIQCGEITHTENVWERYYFIYNLMISPSIWLPVCQVPSFFYLSGYEAAVISHIKAGTHAPLAY